MPEYLKHIQVKNPVTLDPLGLDGTNPMLEITRKIHVETVDKIDEAITKAILCTVKECGVTDLYLIDKEFIVTAIKNELERRKGE